MCRVIRRIRGVTGFNRSDFHQTGMAAFTSKGLFVVDTGLRLISLSSDGFSGEQKAMHCELRYMNLEFLSCPVSLLGAGHLDKSLLRS